MSGSAWRFEGMGVESESLIGTDWIVPNAREREERETWRKWMVGNSGSFSSWGIFYLSIYLAK